MDAFVGKDSSLRYWKLHDLGAAQTPSQALPRSAAPSKQELAQLNVKQFGIVDEPLHLIVASSEQRRSRHDVISHVIEDCPRRSFLQLAPSVYVATPEACFLQIAPDRSLLDLVLIGYELCGHYATHPFSLDSRIVDLAPRSAVASLASFIDRAGAKRGSAHAKKALRYVCDNSASPRETVLTLLLCLPSSLGGYGLPMPRLNHPVVIENEQHRATTLRCDLCWPEHGLALEYDSSLHHSTVHKLNEDSIRRSRIETKKIHVVSVTNQQVKNIRALDELAHVVACRLEKRIRTTRPDIMERRFKLHGKLTGSRLP